MSIPFFGEPPALPTSQKFDPRDPFRNSAPAPSVQSQHELAGRGVRLEDALRQQQAVQEARTAEVDDLAAASAWLRQHGAKALVMLVKRVMKLEEKINERAD
jgi:hypothetical protein